MTERLVGPSVVVGKHVLARERALRLACYLGASDDRAVTAMYPANIRMAGINTVLAYSGTAYCPMVIRNV